MSTCIGEAPNKGLELTHTHFEGIRTLKSRIHGKLAVLTVSQEAAQDYAVALTG